jgi:glycosyltransferase involved in cell wall biosynthesis
MGSWGERKNVLGVLRTYLHEFSREDKTKLVIISQDADFKVLHSVLARSGIPPAELPGLSIPDRELSPEEIIQLHREADCFVSTTRGEGWGLGMFEAMIMQRPVVAPCEGGQINFLDGFDDQWCPTLTQLTPVFAGEGEVEVGNGVVSGKLRLPNGASARQLWFEPSLAGTANQMRAVYERHRARDYSCYQANRQELEDRFSAPVVGSLFKGVLEGIR